MSGLDVASGIIGIAAVGAKLSTTLYTFATAVAAAEQDITDVAGDIALTANVLESVGTFLSEPDTATIASQGALADAEGILKRCRATFGEIQETIDKGSRAGKDGKQIVSKRAQFFWPFKGTRIELLKRRLESLKTSLMLLLKVLQFAKQQATGTLVTETIRDEFASIRALHERQGITASRIEHLEKRMADASLDGSSSSEPTTVSSGILTTNLHVVGQSNPSTLVPFAEDSSDSSTEGEDTAYPIPSAKDLEACERKVRRLLRKVEAAQQIINHDAPGVDLWNRKHRRRIHKSYIKLCKHFNPVLNSLYQPHIALPNGFPAASQPNIMAQSPAMSTASFTSPPPFNLNLILRTDSLPFPVNIRAAKPSIPSNCATWAQLKQWVSENPDQRFSLETVLRLQQAVYLRLIQQQQNQQGGQAAGSIKPATMAPEMAASKSQSSIIPMGDDSQISVTAEDIRHFRQRFGSQITNKSDEEVGRLIRDLKKKYKSASVQRSNNSVPSAPPQMGMQRALSAEPALNSASAAMAMQTPRAALNASRQLTVSPTMPFLSQSERLPIGMRQNVPHTVDPRHVMLTLPSPVATHTKSATESNSSAKVDPQSHIALGPAMEEARVSSRQAALEDYQNQLLLLESQNKRRLMNARREQDWTAGQLEVGRMSPQGSRGTMNMSASEQFVEARNDKAAGDSAPQDSQARLRMLLELRRRQEQQQQQQQQGGLPRMQFNIQQSQPSAVQRQSMAQVTSVGQNISSGETTATDIKSEFSGYRSPTGMESNSSSLSRGIKRQRSPQQSAYLDGSEEEEEEDLRGRGVPRYCRPDAVRELYMPNKRSKVGENSSSDDDDVSVAKMLLARWTTVGPGIPDAAPTLS